MASFNQQQSVYNIANSIGSNSRAPILVPEEYHHWADRMEDYLYGLSPEVWRSIEVGPFTPPAGSNRSINDYLTTSETTVQALADKKMIENDLRCKRELRYGIPPKIFSLIQSCKTAREIWMKLKYMYEGTDKQKKNMKTTLISEFRDFKQKENESLDEVFENYQVLIDKLERAEIIKDPHEVNVTFLHSLRKEWKFITTMIKGHEKMDDYTLFDLLGILKAHEEDIVEKINESASGGSFALLSKENMVKRNVVNAHEEEADDVDEQLDSEELEYAFYVNNNGKKFYRNNAGNSRFKQGYNKFNNFQANNSEKFKQAAVHEKNDEKKVEKKVDERELRGDSGYDCNYCFGKNHLARDCMLKKQNEKA